MYNLLLYFGLFFLIGGFSLFLYSEIKLREIDIQLFKLEQKIEKLKNEWFKIVSGYKLSSICNKG